MTGTGAQGRSAIRETLARHGLRPRKHLGQHFLADPALTRKIVRVAGVGSGDRVVEVGAGTGTLTAELAATRAHVVAIEVDEALRPVLEEVVGGVSNVDLRFRDALRAGLGELPGEPWVMVANLPYNIGTPLVLDLLRTAPNIVRFVIMVQREVAERFVAEPGDEAYGVPSVVVSSYAQARVAFRVPPQVFFPPPDVESAVVVIERRSGKRPEHVDRAVELAAAAFRGRRKMLRRSLRGLVAHPEDVLAAAGVAAMARAEELTAADYLRLAQAENTRT